MHERWLMEELGRVLLRFVCFSTDKFTDGSYCDCSADGDADLV